MELQEIFNRTVRHLATQGGPARMRKPLGDHGHSEMLCAYRGDGGRRCSVGYWILDDKYLPKIEGLAFVTKSLGVPFEIEVADTIADMLPPEMNAREKSVVRLLHSLQKAHDSALTTGPGSPPESWKTPWSLYDDVAEGIAARLEACAGEFGLDAAVVYEVFPRDE